MIHTPRLILRRLTVSDADLLVELDSDPEVMRFLSGGRPTPREIVTDEVIPMMLRESAGDCFGFWAVMDQEIDCFAGWVSFIPRGAGTIELGYRFRRDFWGKGYAAEASRAVVDRGFREPEVERVFATTYEFNHASRRVMEKLGMSLVRRFRYQPAGVEHPLTFVPDGGELWEGEDVEYAVEQKDWLRHGG